MNKVFWHAPYQTELITRVEQIYGDEIIPVDTIGYSFSGGQESDRVIINGQVVVSSRMEGDSILYMLPEHALSAGDEIEMKIDWERRYRLMRLHFAAELILELVTKELGLEKVGAHISESKARIDFKSDTNISASFDRLMSLYTEIIEANYPIETGYTDRALQRRYWKIEGLAQVPCGGTHVRSTQEVGGVKLKRERPGKSIERVEIRLEYP